MREARGQTGCESTDGRRPEQPGPQTQRVGSWWARAGEGAGGTADGDMAPFGGWNVLELVNGGCCTTSHENTLNCTL